MTSLAERFAAAAEALEGTIFRLHGRDPANGIDCIGLVGAALEACGRHVLYPSGYRLRNRSIETWLGFAEANRLVAAASTIERGDVVLTRPGPGQHHLLVALGCGRFAHAHAGLRRVVVQHLDIPRRPLAHWRLSPETEALWLP